MEEVQPIGLGRNNYRDTFELATLFLTFHPIGFPVHATRPKTILKPSKNRKWPFERDGGIADFGFQKNLKIDKNRP